MEILRYFIKHIGKEIVNKIVNKIVNNRSEGIRGDQYIYNLNEDSYNRKLRLW